MSNENKKKIDWDDLSVATEADVAHSLMKGGLSRSEKAKGFDGDNMGGPR